MYFDPNPTNYQNDKTKPYWLQRRKSAISVETSAYALLAQMELGYYDYAGRIVIWLSKQQNYDGGFVSTQVSFNLLVTYRSRKSSFQSQSGQNVVEMLSRNTFRAKIHEDISFSISILAHPFHSH